MTNPGPNKSVTYKDIAKQCGVSMMTVSRVLRNTGHVKASTRQKVLEAAKLLGYRPNPLVQTLMSSVRRGHTDRQANLAWIATYPLHDPHSPYMTVLEKAARGRADRLGFGLEPLSLHDADYSPQRLARILRARNVAGIIVAPLRRPGEDLPLPWDDFPAATIGRSLVRPRIHYTMTHFQHIMEQVLHQLSSRGYHRIAYFEDSLMSQRQDFSAVMFYEHFQMNQPARNRLPVVSSDGWSTEKIMAWIEKKKPDAIISGSPRVYDILHDSGVDIPGDLGFATLSWRPNRPDCSGVRHPFEELGMGAVDIVVAQIHRNEWGLPPHTKAMLFEGEWVEGSTLRRQEV